MTRRTCRILVALLLFCGAADAQLRLPSLGGGLSPLTRSPLVQQVDNLAQPLLAPVLAPVDLATSRLSEATQRGRAYRRQLERDPHGELIVRAEILAAPSNPAARDALLAAGFQPLREDALDGLDDTLVVLKAPRGTGLADAVARARALDPAGAYDFHHVYGGSGHVGAAGAVAASVPALASSSAASAVRVGLIDSGVDARHPALRDATLVRHGCEDGEHPAAHGTAVASLMVGEAAHFQSAAPRATLYAGDAYCDAPTGGSVEAIARELAWLARERVAVVNISLVGPENLILQRLVARAVAQGMLIVAAVGNDGPAAPPLYPASWPGVVGVGGVDGKLRLLPEGARGPQVMFVAPGADMAAAAAGTRAFAPVRGTSFAAPFVAGLLATTYATASPAGARDALARLAASARELPAAPREGVGRGLVAEALRTPVDAVSLAR